MPNALEPKIAARQRVVKFLLDTGLSWSTFVQTFATLEGVVTASTNISGKSDLTRVVLELYGFFKQKVKRRSPVKWRKFYKAVFASMDKASMLPEGVVWDKYGKGDWRLKRVAPSRDGMVGLINKTIKVRGDKTAHIFESKHPLILKGAVLSADSEHLPKTHRKVEGTVRQLTDRAYAVELRVSIPLRNVDQRTDHMRRSYIDQSKVDKLIAKLVPDAGRLYHTRAREVRAGIGACFVEKLSIVVRP